MAFVADLELLMFNKKMKSNIDTKVEAIQDMPKPEPATEENEGTQNEPPSGNDNTEFFKGLD